ncbi:MAG: Omp28 family outer membrane lipoprotein [Bacteroidetes bacterium]|nr:Omp28 family outer membrane lipoprotein [Bacteroidota bacterium]
MKFNRSLLLLIPVTGFLLFSCDKIKAPYAALKRIDTTSVNVRKVLLEDYTGHTCTNCPTASGIAFTLENTYSGKLIVMAVHAGQTAEPTDPPFAADYTTSAGDEWYSTFGFFANPLGMVNRHEFSGSRLLTSDLWASSVDSMFTRPLEAIITISNTYDTDGDILTTSVSTKFKKVLTGSYFLNVCITEDSLISAQKNNNPNAGAVPIINNYVFMDVLRTSINGNSGEEITSATDTSRTYTKTYIEPLDPSWVPKNCSVICFVYNSETKEIIQAEKVGVMKTGK